jgi:hypothetical protein
MMLTALIRVALPQLIVRWLPAVAVLTVGLGLALAVARASVLGPMAGLMAIVFFFVFWLLAEAFGCSVIERVVKMRFPDEISVQLRKEHDVVISAGAIDGTLFPSHVLMGVALIALMFRLFGGCDC